MANTFYVNGTQMNAFVFNNPEGQVPAVCGANQVATANADATSINGSTSIDMAGTTFTQHGVVYPGGKNITTTKDISVLMRVKFTTFAASQVLFSIGGFSRDPQSNIELYVDTSGNIKSYMYNDGYLRGINNIQFTSSLSTGTWYDVFMTWDNSTKVLEVFVDGTSLGTTTSTRDFTSHWTYQNMTQIMLGMGDVAYNTEYRVDEFAIWDSIEDPTASGHNFNGSTRSSYFAYTATVADTDPGIANVRSGTGYVFGGSSLTGTAVIPSADDVRNGTAVGATTGNMTLPNPSDVESGVAYGTNGTNLTGTLDLPSENDVRSGTTYNNSSNTGNMTLPAVGDVQETVTYGTSGTELTGTLGLPAEAEVQNGVGFGANNTEFTGSLVDGSPSESDVRSGVTYGSNTGNLTVPAIGDVRSGTQYGANGTQYTGSLSVTGGDPVKKKINTGNIG